MNCNDIIKEINDKFKLFNLYNEKNIINKFDKYYEIIINHKKNICGHKKIEDIYLKDFIDSLLYSFFISDEKIKVLDIGTGAGFPGIPIKIIKPNIILYLLDSKKNICIFLENLIKKLELSNIEIINIDLNKYLKINTIDFDIVVFRAFKKFPISIIYSTYLIKKNSLIITSLTEKMFVEYINNHLFNELLFNIGLKIELIKEFNFDNFKRYIIKLKKIENKSFNIKKLIKNFS